MKRSLFLSLLALLCGFALFAHAGHVVGPNLVANGGFELGIDKYWFPAGWEVHDRDDSTEFLPFQAYSGRFAAQLGPEEHRGRLAQTLPTVVGQAYKLSYALMSDGINNEPNKSFTAYLDHKTIKGSILYNIPSGEWQLNEFWFVATSNQTQLVFKYLDPPGYYYLDHVEVRAWVDGGLDTDVINAPRQILPSVALPNDVLSNGGFELGLFRGWQLANDPDTLSRVVDFYSHSGYSSLEMGPGPEDGPSVLSQTFKAKKGDVYLLEFWLANDPDGDLPENKFFAAYINGRLANGTQINNLPGTDFKHFRYRFVADAASNTLAFKYANDAGYYYLDDVSIVPLV